MGRPKRKQQQTKAARASMSQQQIDNTNNNELNENESLNQVESTIINNQTNQNLSISAASAAALPLLQQINSSLTNNAMDTSQNDINDVNNQLLDQQQQHSLLQSTLPSTFQQPAPQVPQAPGGETNELELLNELYNRIRNYGNLKVSESRVLVSIEVA
jgi:hypothetical protein